MAWMLDNHGSWLSARAERLPCRPARSDVAGRSGHESSGAQHSPDRAHPGPRVGETLIGCLRTGGYPLRSWHQLIEARLAEEAAVESLLYFDLCVFRATGAERRLLQECGLSPG